MNDEEKGVTIVVLVAAFALGIFLGMEWANNSLRPGDIYILGDELIYVDGKGGYFPLKKRDGFWMFEAKGGVWQHPIESPRN